MYHGIYQPYARRETPPLYFFFTCLQNTFKNDAYFACFVCLPAFDARVVTRIRSAPLYSYLKRACLLVFEARQISRIWSAPDYSYLKARLVTRVCEACLFTRVWRHACLLVYAARLFTRLWSTRNACSFAFEARLFTRIWSAPVYSYLKRTSLLVFEGAPV